MKTGRILGIAALLLVLVATALLLGPAVFRVDIFDGDAAHHVFWLYRYADPVLFPGDITVDYLRTSAPLGYRILYAGAAHFMDVALATKLVAVLLVFWSGWMAWKIGTAIEGPDSELRGLLAVASLMAILACAPEADLLQVMALQRTFALPLTLLCLWALIAGRYAWVGGSWLLAALFYPVVLPTLGLGAAVVFLFDLIRSGRMPSRWVVNAVLAVAAVALAVFGMPKAESLGPAATFTQAMSMPEFGLGGRMDLYGVPGPRDWIWNPIMGLSWSPRVLLAFVAAVGVAWLTGQRRLLPLAAWALLAVGLAWWLALRLFPAQLMFGLYVPNRHSRWVIAAFGIVALVGAAYGLLLFLLRNTAPKRREGRNLLFAAAAVILSIGLLVPQFHRQVSTPVNRDLENTYTFIAGLPKETLVAAHPDLANYIPVRTRHSVLTSTETAMPWLLHYLELVKPRVVASLHAAYATRIEEMDQQLAPYGVGVFVTGPEVWKETGYQQPYDPMVQQLLAKGRKEGFVLRQPPSSRILFRSGDYYVLRVVKP